MGVRYVLEGSVQRAEQQVRITTQLIDATTGYQLWSEQYDRPLKDIFALQDEVVQKIVTTLDLQLTLQEQGVSVRKHTAHLEAYDASLRGLEYYLRLTQEAFVQARQLFEKAIALDPQYVQAYAQLGWTYMVEWAFHWSANPQIPERALALAQQAVALDDSLPAGHELLSRVYAQKQQSDQAIAEGERVLVLDPNNAESYALLAEVLNFASRPEEALRLMERARRFNPHYPAYYLDTLGWAYLLTGQYAEAIATLQETISRSPNFIHAHYFLALSYLGQWIAQQSPAGQTLEPAVAAAQHVISLNHALPEGHGVLGTIYLYQKQYDQALAETERVIALIPNDAGSYAGLAAILSCVGRSEKALGMVEQTLRRNPSGSAYSSIGIAYYLAGRPEEAVAPLKQYLSHAHNLLGAHLNLAEVYSELGKEAEAR